MLIGLLPGVGSWGLGYLGMESTLYIRAQSQIDWPMRMITTTENCGSGWLVIVCVFISRQKHTPSG